MALRRAQDAQGIKKLADELRWKVITQFALAYAFQPELQLEHSTLVDFVNHVLIKCAASSLDMFDELSLNNGYRGAISLINHFDRQDFRGPEGEAVPGGARCALAIGFSDCTPTPSHGITPLQNQRSSSMRSAR